MAVANFTLAIDRPARQGEERKADFIRVVVFGRQAENCEKYLAKGRLVAVEGRLQTGSYKNKNGDTVYTTDVVANRVEFLSTGRQSTGDHLKDAVYDSVDRHANDAPENFEEINEEVPFW